MAFISWNRIEARPATVAILLELLAIGTGSLLFGGALSGLVLGHVVVLAGLVAVGVNAWHRREHTLAQRATAQLLLMTACAEQARQRGEVVPCATCQRPLRRHPQGRCLFCGSGHLPALR